MQLQESRAYAAKLALSLIYISLAGECLPQLRDCAFSFPALRRLSGLLGVLLDQHGVDQMPRPSR
jgi:hypothetical protein